MRLLKDFTGIGRRPTSANSSDSHRSRPDSYRARRQRCTLGLERLEDRVALSNFVLSNLASFNGATGSGPRAGLILDAQGNLYGTTDGGGANGQGTVFELAAGSGTLTTLASFNGANGAYPNAGLITDAQGNLYGTTANGGAFNSGTVFELAAGSNTITTLASFDGTNGAHPDAGLIMDAQGNLYGTTYGGGANGQGTVFELAAGSGAITTLATFNGANGAHPLAGLILDAQGNLYGTTQGGGANGRGTVFELAAGSGTITTLANFNGTNGAYPDAGLITDAQGNLYGTTSNGGAFDDNGTVFELAAGSNTITTLASFDGTNGVHPDAGLIMDAQGNLYGTTAMAPGAPSRGTVFELAAGSGTITTLASFNGANGANPEAGLILDAQGNLYGTTYFGGAFGQGTVFELSPVPGAPPPVVQVPGAPPPVVTAFSPAAGATGVDPNNFEATVTFDQPVQIAGMGSPGNFSLHSTSGEGPAIASSISYDSSTNTATLTPLAPLAPLTTYQVVVSGIENTAGTPMSSPTTWTFMTGTTSD